MLVALLEKFSLSHDGKIDWVKVAVPGVFFGGFILWRVASVGTHGSQEILGYLERELIDDYKVALYKKHGFYDGTAADRMAQGAERDEQFPHEEFRDLDVTFANVSMSAPLTSWSVSEDVEVRFDYTLTADGVRKQHARSVYKRVSHVGNKVVWDSGPFHYYVHYLF